MTAPNKSMRRPRALFVAPWAPTVERPGPVEALKALQREYDVDIVCLTWSEPEEQQLLHAFPHARFLRANKLAGAIRTAFGVPLGRSLEQSFVGKRQLATLIREAVAATPTLYEFAFFNVVRSAHAMTAVPPSVPVVFDLDEVRSDYYSQLATHSPSLLWRTMARIESRSMQRAINRAVARSALVLVTSRRDVSRIGPNGHAIRHSHVFGTTPPVRAIDLDAEPRIVFVGRLSYFANIDGIEWFLDNVWPEVRRAEPSVLLDIVGAGPSPELAARLSAVPGVELHADVPAVLPYLQRATLSISPVRLVTGIQMKLVESLWTGVPAVTTPTIAEGAGVVAGVECYVAEGPEGWIGAVLHALRNPSEREAVAAQGRAWAEVNYNPDRIAEELLATIRDRLSHAR